MAAAQGPSLVDGLLLAQASAPAGSLPPPPLAPLQNSPALAPPPRDAATAKRLPIILRAQSLRSRPDVDALAEGDVELRRGGAVIRADSLRYTQADDLAVARGKVRISRDGATYSGPELQLHLQSFEGFFLQPDYQFSRTGAGGSARRIDFVDEDRAVATEATYTSCLRDGTGTPAWLLSADQVSLDQATNTGVARGAVLRFQGVPILAAPSLSFPLTEERKSGWLPPNIDLDSRGGLQVGVPYYWNIAPNLDATLTPRLALRRGASLDTEVRYLQPQDSGRLMVDLLPYDRLLGRSRHALQFGHEGSAGPALRYSASAEQVSDNDWWKDFPRAHAALTPRLLPLNAQVEQDLGNSRHSLLLYARVQRWQVLQAGANALTDEVDSPFQRSPQLGLRAGGTLESGLAGGLEYSAETEANRFTLPGDAGYTAAGKTRPGAGARWHALGSVSRPWRQPGWWVVPKFSVNAAAYATDQPMADGRRSASRVIPTFSIDGGLELERDTTWFGRALRQTLEPRLLYVNTPYRAQSTLPSFDAQGKDFNFASIYSENAFSGVDRVSDAHQLTAGVTTRLVDAASGAEALRLGLVQRYLFRDQRVTCATPDAGQADCTPFTQRFSDLLLLASSNMVRDWTLDAAVQYSPDIARSVRSIVGARWSPGPFKTLSANYRLARGLSEQLELGWQWPLRGAVPGAARGAAAASACGGTWYGVGRINYSLRDSRITDSIVGAEYDSGCWIARVVAERLSTGRSEATTRLLLQLELVGLSRLGSNPLKVLKDNIPGYRLLREERSDTPAPTFHD